MVSGYRAPRWYVYWLFSFLYGIITFSIELFWDNYVIKETKFCENENNHQACFIMPQDYSDIDWYAYPLTSCDDIENKSNFVSNLSSILVKPQELLAGCS